VRDKDLMRFLAKVNFTGGPDGCWTWTSAMNWRGYGAYWLLGTKQSAHRVAYSHAYGSIPTGLTLDHICRNRACVRPSHLRPVSIRENVLAEGSLSITKTNAMKTQCVHGHRFDLANTYVFRGQRYCRMCIARRKALRAKLGVNP
jgi:hypothetical protein